MPLDVSAPRTISFGFQGLGRQGLVLTAAGIALGIGLAAALTRVMTAFLFGVDPIDPATYGAVPVILTATALLAAYLPARRASRVNPIIALRADV